MRVNLDNVFDHVSTCAPTKRAGLANRGGAVAKTGRTALSKCPALRVVEPSEGKEEKAADRNTVSGQKASRIAAAQRAARPVRAA